MATPGNIGTDQLLLLSAGEEECDLVQKEILSRSQLSVIVKKPTIMKNVGPHDEYSNVRESVSEMISDFPNLNDHLPETKSDHPSCTTASIRSMVKSVSILPTNQFRSSTSHSPSPARSRLGNRLSLKRKGRKTLSTQTPKLASPGQQLLNLDTILQTSPILSDKNLYQASTDTSGAKLCNSLEKIQERRTKSARVTSAKQRPGFLSGDGVWSSDDEFDSVRLVRRLDDEDWQPGGKMRMSRKKMKRKENERKHFGKRKLFSIGRDYMDDSAESDEENLKNERTKSLKFSRSRKGILSTVEKLKREGSLADQLGVEVNSSVQRWK